MIEISVLISSLLLLIAFCFENRKKASTLISEYNSRMENNNLIEQQIKDVETQIEIINKKLILFDENIQKVSVNIKKLIIVYKNKEQDLKEKFIKVNNDSKTKLTQEYQKKFLIEALEVESTHIMNDILIRKKFVELASSHFPNSKK